MRMILLFSLTMLAVAAGADLTVFAAASTTDAMKEAAALYEKETGVKVRFNFAGSGALARQIDAGAPADLFLSANVKWMEYLEERQRILKESCSDLLKNRLVLIEPRKKANEHGADVFDLVRKYKRLAVGDFRSVPAGGYAGQALKYGGVLEEMRGKLVTGDSVRRVLFYVERGEVDAGIVYVTDTGISSKVKTVAVFPEAAHEPICYPAAVCKSSRQKDAALRFLEFLRSEEAREVFKKYGFGTVDR